MNQGDCIGNAGTVVSNPCGGLTACLVPKEGHCKLTTMEQLSCASRLLCQRSLCANHGSRVIDQDHDAYLASTALENGASTPTLT